eukprot:jgi/Botrbrau1/19368/Bobra.0338s0003.1
MEVGIPAAAVVVPIANTALITASKSALEALKGMTRRASSGMDDGGRSVIIVSTAAIPWLTGTAVNPCLRAAYLAQEPDIRVTLLIPWLAAPDQSVLFPKGVTFQLPEEQEAHIRLWLQQRTGVFPTFPIAFYPGRYDRTMLGIFPVGDLTAFVPEGLCDIAVLEEPEHLTWFHHGPRWTDKFQHVVGIMHTNYAELARRNAGLPLKHASLALNHLLCSIHCHKVIKLSDAVQTLPRQITSCVHGVASAFFEIGTDAGDIGRYRFSKGAYCLGKLVWGKGWEELFEILPSRLRTSVGGASKREGTAFSLDVYGDGEARQWLEEKARSRNLPVVFHGKRDHLDPSLHAYQVFINASTSDVVATTSLEALAMGKWLLCAEHPCNAFAASFPNTLPYRTAAEFCQQLAYALRKPPPPLPQSELKRLTWHAATKRLIQASKIKEDEWPHPISSAQEAILWRLYNTIIGIEAVRGVVCAGKNTARTYSGVTEYTPELEEPSFEGNWVSWMLTVFSRISITVHVGTMRLALGP